MKYIILMIWFLPTCIFGQDTLYKYRKITYVKGQVTKSEDVTLEWIALHTTMDSLKKTIEKNKPEKKSASLPVPELKTPDSGNALQTVVPKPVNLKIPAGLNPDFVVDGKNGDDSNPGTPDAPFKTIEKAFVRASGKQLILVKGGVYKPVQLNQGSGLRFAGHGGLGVDKMLRIWSFPGERVMLDCAGMTNNQDGLIGISVEFPYIHLKGFDVMNVPQKKGPDGRGYYSIGILIKAGGCILEDCKAYNNQGTGINIGGNATFLCHVLNCDSYNNYDPYTFMNDVLSPGNNADGFHVTCNGLDNNIFLKGCRAWNNSDDGYDFFNTDGYINVDSCWAFKNGFLADNSKSEGDGNGFKLGKTVGQYDILKRWVGHCLSIENKSAGITQNNGKVVMKIYNNTCYLNGDMPFDFANNFVGQQHVELSKNIAVGSKNYIPFALQNRNTWNLQVVANGDDFKSTKVELLKAPRGKNGSLPKNDAFRLKPGSDLMGLGAF